jgi:hypothetical protein
MPISDKIEIINIKKLNDDNKNLFNMRKSYDEKPTKITSLLDKYSKIFLYNDADPYFNGIHTLNNKHNYNYNKYSFRSDKFNEKESIYLNNYFFYANKNNKINKNENENEHENEFSKSITSLKNNIIKNERLSFGLLEKIKILTKITFCFSRIINKNSTKYNPVEKISNENLCKSPYFFKKSSISLNKSYKYIRIGLATQLDPIDINLKDIKYTVVSSNMKTMIEIYRDYKKSGRNKYDEFDKDFFIKKEMESNALFDYDYIHKCIFNKKFNFILYYEGNQNQQIQIEFLFCSYEDFKMWINGFAYIIRNKKQIIELIED